MRRAGLLGGAILIGAAAGQSAAGAVELVNRDRAEQEVTVNHSDGRSETRTIRPGERIGDLCADCVILVGEGSVEAKGSMTVKIERGKVSIDVNR